MGLAVGLKDQKEMVPLLAIGPDPRVLGQYVCPMVYLSVVALFQHVPEFI